MRRMMAGVFAGSAMMLVSVAQAQDLSFEFFYNTDPDVDFGPNTAGTMDVTLVDDPSNGQKLNISYANKNPTDPLNNTYQANVVGFTFGFDTNFVTGMDGANLGLIDTTTPLFFKKNDTSFPGVGMQPFTNIALTNNPSGGNPNNSFDSIPVGGSDTYMITGFTDSLTTGDLPSVFGCNGTCNVGVRMQSIGVDGADSESAFLVASPASVSD